MIEKLRGTKDILPDESNIWLSIESKFRKICYNSGFKEIRTPTFERTELFSRSMGDLTDVVEKEMYTFFDKSGRKISLKPEVTAGTVRAIIENSLYATDNILKLYYISQCFRYERPQSGRMREFHQLGIELFGSTSPESDAEIIFIAHNYLSTLLERPLEIKINTIGCNECKESFSKNLKKHFEPTINQMCEDCQKRCNNNPFRILDCKKCTSNPELSEILSSCPKIIENLCKNCEEHFFELTSLLSEYDLNFKIDNNIVRGLDYYTKTVFEISEEHGLTVCGGGRYDNLVEQLGGPSIPAVGFAIGMERLIHMLSEEQKNDLKQDSPTFFIINANNLPYLKKLVRKIAKAMRLEGFAADFSLIDKNLKSQLKHANKISAKFVIILGETEVQKQSLIVRNMTERNETEIDFNFENIPEEIYKFNTFLES